ncbi:energy-converting hydrogenase subunit EhaL family protein [Methanothermobacter tenebrarum]
MAYFTYLPHLLMFTIGMLIGLEVSYKWHSEPFVRKRIEPIPLILALIGGGLMIIYAPVGLFFIGFVMGMRPGYGVYESIIGILFALILWVTL